MRAQRGVTLQTGTQGYIFLEFFSKLKNREDIERGLHEKRKGKGRKRRKKKRVIKHTLKYLLGMNFSGWPEYITLYFFHKNLTDSLSMVLCVLFSLNFFKQTLHRRAVVIYEFFSFLTKLPSSSWAEIHCKIFRRILFCKIRPEKSPLGFA